MRGLGRGQDAPRQKVTAGNVRTGWGRTVQPVTGQWDHVPTIRRSFGRVQRLGGGTPHS